MPALGGAELLALMDANLIGCVTADTRTTPGGVVVERDGLVCCRTPRGSLGTNVAIVTGPTTARAVRAAVRAVFGDTRRPFSVWTREHADADLAADLRAARFQEIHREPGMALLPEAACPVPPPPEVVVRPVRDHAARSAYARVVARAFAVYDVPEDATAEHFQTLPSVAGDDRQAFLAWRGKEPVAGALLYMTHGVGGIGWVGVAPEEFGQGYGPAVTWVAVTEGLRRGARFLNLQASPMGAPVYARMGFVTPTHYRWFLAPG